MPELYSDDNGARVIVRHTGPAGKGFPAGGTAGQILAKGSGDDYDATWVNPPDGTDAVYGPASSVDGNLALFDGVTGKLLKDTGISVASLASAVLVETKVDKIPGYGLSKNDFTDALKTKLVAIQSTSGYRGSFVDLDAANAYAFNPPPIPGDYCLLGEVGADPQMVLWDEIKAEWVPSFPDAVAMTGQEIADLLFDAEDAAAWDVDTCRIFTETEKTQLAAINSLVDGALGGIIAGVTSYVEKTSAYTISTNDRTINCTNNSFALTLPTAVGNTGRIFTIKNSGTGTITINTTDGVQTIDGSTSVSLTTQWESVTLQSTGSGWIII